MHLMFSPGRLIEIAQGPHLIYIKHPIRALLKGLKKITDLIMNLFTPQHSKSYSLEGYLLRRLKTIVENFPQLECPLTNPISEEQKPHWPSSRSIDLTRDKSDNFADKLYLKILQDSLYTTQEILEKLNLEKPLSSQQLS